jgi:cyclopropane fatty-acyl-phospholipid synthase-like methyltransferase
MSNELLKTVSTYYTDKVKEHGATPKGVDWNNKESQYLRFEKLCNLIEPGQFSLLDYGCGTGDFFNYLSKRHKDFKYHGFDISSEMIKTARGLIQDNKAAFSLTPPEEKFDYVVGSGIFNVRFHYNDDEWRAHIQNVLEDFNQKSNKGFSFNVLSLYSDVEKRRSDLYYADSLFLFDWCKKNISRYVTLIHDYPLYEFTMIVRK